MPKVRHNRSASSFARSRFSSDTGFFTARIKIFLGECSISINSNKSVLYPQYSSTHPRIASVINAAVRSLMIPYLVSADNSSDRICLFNSCWQHGTDRCMSCSNRSHCRAHSQLPYHRHARSLPYQLYGLSGIH